MTFDCPQMSRHPKGHPATLKDFAIAAIFKECADGWPWYEEPACEMLKIIEWICLA